MATNELTPAQPAPLEVPVDGLEQEVFAALDLLENPKKSWTAGLITLAVSLALFVGSGLVSSPASGLAMIVVVLFIHESGHYLGMRMFGYRNIRMFFIPFFGAAVSGRGTNAEGYQKAIVTLLGPLPGLWLGYGLGFVYLMTPAGREAPAWLMELAIMFIAINAFNLLPLYPLDGGRLLFDVVFARNRYVEAACRAIMGLALLAMGVEVWALGLVGGLVLFATPQVCAWRLAHGLRQKGVGVNANSEGVPRDAAREILSAVRASMPQLFRPRLLATMVHSVWEKLAAKNPGIGASAALLFVYAASVLSVPAAIAAYILTQPHPASQ